MGWHVGHDLGAHDGAARAFLESDPVVNTIHLTLLAGLTTGASWGDSAPVFAEHTGTDGAVDAAAVMTPPYPLVVTGRADPAGLVAAVELADVVGDIGISGVNAHESMAVAVGEAWRERHGGTAVPDLRLHLLELFRFDPPGPERVPPGRARPAVEADAAVVHTLIAAMQDELGEPRSAGRHVDDRIARRRVWLWDLDGDAVATAGATEAVSGVARIVAVYTRPEARGRGVGAAVTAACVAGQLAAGVPRLCLFTDAANPTSNGIYERLGFRRRQDDQLRLRFGAGPSS